MNILELAEQYPNAIISICAQDLINANRILIDRAREEMEQRIAEEKTEMYPSREKVMEILGVSAPTLWRWEKTGYLKTVRLGGKVRYRMSDVKHMLQDKK